MRIAYVEMCGFRGFRDRTRIEVPHGFLIVTGRNGSGKSTICDAVEFALTGTIDKYAIEKGGKESLADYIWWRGENPPDAHFVSVGFVDGEGKVIEVKRSREKTSADGLALLEDSLCDGARPPDALQHLCKTSIIRDELIAATSLDLSDPARFEFVRSALGAIAHGDLLGRVHAIYVAAEAQLAAAEKDAELANSRMRTALADLSDTRATAAQATDVESATEFLRRFLGDSESSVVQILDAARQRLARRRLAMNVLADRLGRLEELRKETNSEAFEARRARAVAQQDVSNREQQNIARELAEAEAQLIRERANHATAASLSSLLEAGEHLGLDEQGRCPLCQTKRSEDQFAQALDSLRKRVGAISTALAEAGARVAELRPKESAARLDLQKAVVEAEECNRQLATVERQTAEVQAAWHTFVGDETALPQTSEIAKRIAVERERLVEAERNILVLEASQAIERVAQSEALVETIRNDVDAAGNRVAAAQSAVQALEAAEKSVRRVNAEIVDERLASISPLLSELYYRLRPHQNWREIDYAIRGDVRRFLSLRVGEDLNPQFIFSSGQRRAAGLAFLLAVHLSRPWCRWKTIMLDDPVQHIDDFRALQLVEVLSAFRKVDRQVVCAVEDPALATVLCRRLRSTLESPGGQIELEYDSSGSCRRASQDRIVPLPVLLRSAAS
jgi:DNA repair exonuclease SbcCD ATPase subunit